MKILLFGGAGQLGREVDKRARDLNFEVVSPVISELDISEEKQVRFLASQLKPEIIINCAAYTAVDKAESEPDVAFKINAQGAANAALAALDSGARLIHISTDYVFSGEGNVPLKEDAPTSPRSVYGRSKLEGEHEVERILKGEGLIVRTSSLHGRYGGNFVHTMLKLFDEKKTVRVVNDQWMSPCWAGFLAEVLLDLARLQTQGTLHVACGGVITWFDFARKILELAYPHASPGERSVVEPQAMSELDRPAPRPQYSAFDLTRLSELLGRPPLPWEQGLEHHLREIGRVGG